MPAHKRFREIQDEDFKEHDYKTDLYNKGVAPLDNWKLVKPRLRPWEGCYSRLTEKIARLFVLVPDAEKDPKMFKELLKEIRVYTTMVQILFEEDFIEKVKDSIEVAEKLNFGKQTSWFNDNGEGVCTYCGKRMVEGHDKYSRCI